MKLDHVIVQNPASSPAQLFLLFHTNGDNPQGMTQIGMPFATAFPQALVVSIGAPAVPDETQRAWFAQDGLTEENYQSRVDGALPAVIACVQEWQQRSGISAAATALIGFSAGATVVLEALKAQQALAGRAVIFSGRYATLPQRASTGTTLHLIHGDDDRTVPLTHAIDAEAALSALGGDVTLDIVDDLPHAIDQRAVAFALQRLQYTVPKRYFDEMFSSGTPGDDDVIPMI